MEPQAKSKLIKWSFLATGIFLILSLAAAVAERADPLNGNYYSQGIGALTYLEFEYNKHNVNLIERSMCGNCDENNPILLYGKPERNGNKLLLRDHKTPTVIVAEITLQPNGDWDYQYTDYDGKKLNLTFTKSKEPLSLNGLLLRLGVPRALLP